MVSVFDVDASKLIVELAKELKKDPKIKTPSWISYAKTGADRERPVDDVENFWSIRAASILRNSYTHGTVGVSRLRTKYGSKKNRGAQPDKFFKTGGKNIRLILQQLQESGYVKLVKGEGREITKKGMSLVDKVAAKIAKTEPKAIVKKVETPANIEIVKKVEV